MAPPVELPEHWGDLDNFTEKLKSDRNKARRQLVQEYYAILQNAADRAEGLAEGRVAEIKSFAARFRRVLYDTIELIEAGQKLDSQGRVFRNLRALLTFANALESRGTMRVALEEEKARRDAEKASQTLPANKTRREESEKIATIIDKHVRAYRKTRANRHRADNAVGEAICDAVNIDLKEKGLRPMKADSIARRVPKSDN